MNFQAILDELTAGAYARFDPNQTTSAKYWINLAYGEIWAAADWPWKQSQSGLTLSTTANTRAIAAWNGTTTSMERLKILHLQDDLGNTLDYVAPQQFFKQGRGKATLLSGETGGRPSEWTSVGGRIWLDPIPDAVYVLTPITEDNIYVRTSAWAYKTGVWDGSTSTDIPAWDEPFHYTIYLGALATGLITENDPTAAEARAIFLQQIEAMKGHFLPWVYPHGQFGRDAL